MPETFKSILTSYLLQGMFMIMITTVNTVVSTVSPAVSTVSPAVSFFTVSPAVSTVCPAVSTVNPFIMMTMNAKPLDIIKSLKIFIFKYLLFNFLKLSLNNCFFQLKFLLFVYH